MNQIIVKHYYKDVVKKTRAVENLKKKIETFRKMDYDMLVEDVINELLFNSHKFITRTKEYSHTIAMGYNKDTKTVYIGWSMLNAIDVKKRLNFKKIGHSMAVKRLASMFTSSLQANSKQNIPYEIFKDADDLIKHKALKYFKVDRIDQVSFYIDNYHMFTTKE